MLWSSAVNLVLTLSLGSQALTASEKAAWQRIEPRIARFQDGTPAVLIDTKGFFLSHRRAAQLPVLFAKFSAGAVVELRVISTDDVTGLCLLQTKDPLPPGMESSKVVHYNHYGVQQASADNSMKLIAVGKTGPFRAELSATNRLGVVGTNRRGVTLSEIRYETPVLAPEGALAFTYEGQLAGVVTAIVEGQAVQAKANALAPGSMTNRIAPPATVMEFGPQSMTVAYSVTPDILQRVVEGFLTGDHKVRHPALGLMSSDAPNEGIRLVNIQKGGPAEAAGLKTDDVILQLNETPIRNVSEYTRFILRTRVGENLTVKFRRGNDVQIVTVKVGASS